jgi:hypothetical protein
LAPARKIKKRKGPRRVNRLKKLRNGRIDPPVTPQRRPTRPDIPYSYDLSEEICERLSNGETGASVCRDPKMPTWAVLQRWRRKHTDFDHRYRIAREACCEYYADDIVDIADDGRNDYVVRTDGRKVFDREAFERSRLRVDTRKWTVSKILRHVYGDKSEVDVRTPDGVNVKVEERNALIDAIVKLVHPKVDGKTKPSGRTEEERER